MKCNLCLKKFFLKNLMETLVKVQRLRDLEVLLYFGFNMEEEDEERVIRDFTTAKERIWL